MVHFPASSTRRQYSAIPFAVIAGLAAPLVLLSAPRAIASDFEACTRSLIEAGIDGSTAAGDCGQALHPTDLSSCVVDITKDTDLDVAQTLVACQSDRRPQELATCVSDIHQNLAIDNSAMVLNNCRRSILPTRYADCVVGVAKAAELAPADSMAQCMVAGYRPEELAPTFIFSR
jgi:hypothetical protein